MKLLILADDDSVQKDIAKEQTDVLVSCGDFADQALLQIAKNIQCSQILAVKGNHDGSGSFPAPIIDLHLNTHTISGFRFGGFNGSWKYKPRGNYLYEQLEVKRYLDLFPPVDIFVAHNSPRHIHDRDDDVHFGFEAFVDYIQRVQPKLFLHGHQHINQETQIGKTKVIGIYGQKKLEL